MHRHASADEIPSAIRGVFGYTPDLQAAAVKNVPGQAKLLCAEWAV